MTRALGNFRDQLLPLAVLVGLALLFLGGWWLFPRLQSMMAYQDCVASFRTNCEEHPTPSN
jgi:hypothetical protein